MSSWETRELPLLRAIEARSKRRGRAKRPLRISVPELAADTGFSEAEVSDSLRVLAEAHGPYITGENLLHAESESYVTGLTDRARVELDKVDRDVHSLGPTQRRRRK